MIGTISSRPSHMSAIITTVEKSLNGSNDPSGPPTPNAGPTLREHARRDRDRVERRQRQARPRRIDREHGRADDEDADVEQDERRDCAQRPLVDDLPVEANREDDLGMHGLVDLAAEELPQK